MTGLFSLRVEEEVEGRPEVDAVREHAVALLDVLTGAVPDGAELGVYLVGDERMHALNLEWRQRDAPTDVLSFPYDPGPDDPVPVLGDVVINLDAALRQAETHGLAPGEECLFLLIHGMLHLLGSTHDGDADRAEMEAEEQRLWEAMGGEGTLRD
jgi:probable rRNA maturation factor